MNRMHVLFTGIDTNQFASTTDINKSEMTLDHSRALNPLRIDKQSFPFVSGSCENTLNLAFCIKKCQPLNM